MANIPEEVPSTYTLVNVHFYTRRVRLTHLIQMPRPSFLFLMSIKTILKHFNAEAV